MPRKLSYWLLTLAVAFTFMLVGRLALAPSPASAQSDGEEYLVQRGDSLSRIAARHYGNGTLWPEIVAATNAKALDDTTFRTIENPSFLYVGQKLWLPVLTNEEDAPPEAGVRFAEPTNGTTVQPEFVVTMDATGLKVEPSGEPSEGSGHLHILIDIPFIAAGEVITAADNILDLAEGQLTATLQLEPGVHVLRLQFADGAHVALDGDQYRDTITITVIEPEDEAETPTSEITTTVEPTLTQVAVTTTVPATPTVEVAAPAAPAPAESDVSVGFITPQNAATVPPQFDVAMEATGLLVEPSGEIREGSGHMHILVDTPFVAPGEVIITDGSHLHYGQGQLTTTLILEPGVHVLRLQFANGAHIALDGDQYRDTISVTVVEPVTTTTPAQPEVGVRFVTPEVGATVPPQFDVAMEATGLKVEPSGEIREGSGHMHILVDTPFVAPGEVIITDGQHLHYGQGQLTTTLQLEPGDHILRLQFANGAHIALDGDQYRDEIEITVAEPTAEVPAEPEVGVRFVTPEDSATVPPQFDVAMEATGLIVEPSGEINEGAGHMHILVDTPFVAPGEVIITDSQHLHYGQGQLTTTLQLAPGDHILRLQFANGAHIALDGDQYRDEIEVTVAQ